MRIQALLAPSLLLAVLLLSGRAASASSLSTPIRLSVSNWRVEPGDTYHLTWMEHGGVQPIDDFILEECTDPQFKDKQNLTKYVVRAHHKTLENNASFTHAVRYYRVRTRAWIQSEGETDQKQEEIISNVVRVTLVGTNKTDPVPAFPDDPEPAVKKKKDEGPGGKKGDKDYPAMGRPDLVCTKVVLEPTPVHVGQQFNVRVTVRNNGVIPSPKTTVLIRVLGRNFETEVETLKPGYGIVVEAPPVVAEDKPIEVHCQVDPHDLVLESREDNNVLDVTFQVLPAEKQPDSK